MNARNDNFGTERLSSLLDIFIKSENCFKLLLTTKLISLSPCNLPCWWGFWFRVVRSLVWCIILQLWFLCAFFTVFVMFIFSIALLCWYSVNACFVFVLLSDCCSCIYVTVGCGFTTQMLVTRFIAHWVITILSFCVTRLRQTLSTY